MPTHAHAQTLRLRLRLRLGTQCIYIYTFLKVQSYVIFPSSLLQSMLSSNERFDQPPLVPSLVAAALSSSLLQSLFFSFPFPVCSSPSHLNTHAIRFFFAIVFSSTRCCFISSVHTTVDLFFFFFCSLLCHCDIHCYLAFACVSSSLPLSPLDLRFFLLYCFPYIYITLPLSHLSFNRPKNAIPYF